MGRKKGSTNKQKKDPKDSPESDDIYVIAEEDKKAQKYTLSLIHAKMKTALGLSTSSDKNRVINEAIKLAEDSLNRLKNKVPLKAE